MIVKFLYNINYGFNGWPSASCASNATGGSPSFSIVDHYRRKVRGDGNGWGGGPTNWTGDGRTPR